MASGKRLVLSVKQKQLTLPKELIPDNVTMFGYELQTDGRIILTPLITTTDEPPDPCGPKPSQKVEEVVPKVINFRAAQRRRKKRVQKNKDTSPSANTDVSMGKKTDFVKLHHFSSRLEAEMLGEILNQSGIPYLIQSEDIGIFGPGAAPAPGGAHITVRRSDLECARNLLSGLI